MKKVLSFILTLTILFGIIASCNIFASAVTFSPRLTAPTRNGYYGTQNSYNPFKTNSSAGNGNCTWYAWGRAYEILGSRPQLSTNNANTWYPRNVSNNNYLYGQIPKLGAIACWNCGDAGHVAVVEQINNDGSITISESSWNAANWWFRTKTISSCSAYLSGFQGFIYIIDDTTPTEPPSNFSIHMDKKIGLINQNFNFNFLSTGAESYWVGVYKDNVLFEETNTNEPSFYVNYPWVGKYDIAVVARNRCGSKESYASFYLGDEGDYTPDNLVVSTNRTIATKEDEIKLTYSATYADNYWIGIYTADGYLYQQDVVSSTSYSFKLPWLGNYSIAVVAMNECSSSNPKYIKITVTETGTKPTIPKISINKNINKINQEVLISFYSENVDEYWIGIYKDDVLFEQKTQSSNTFSLNYPWVGKYDIAVVAMNNIGSTAGYSSFYYGDEGDYIPRDITLTCDKNAALPNEKISLNMSGTFADKFWIGIYTIDSQLIKQEIISSSSYSFSLSQLGEYSICVVAMNECSSANGKYVKLSVRENYVFALQLESILKTDYLTGTNFSENTFNAYAIYKNGNRKEITGNVYITGYDTNKPGEQTITVTYEEDGISVSADYTVKVWGLLEAADVNTDGFINVADITEILNENNYTFSAEKANNSRCDVNKDGLITLTDISLLLSEQTYAMSY